MHVCMINGNKYKNHLSQPLNPCDDPGKVYCSTILTANNADFELLTADLGICGERLTYEMWQVGTRAAFYISQKK